MRVNTLQADDESRMTEISFLPDGRICVFGLSREVLQLLGDLDLGDPGLTRRWESLRCLDPREASKTIETREIGGQA